MSAPLYRYRVRRLGASSEKYGACEVCQERVSDVHYQTEERSYSGGWTHYECTDRFGHLACLESKRRSPYVLAEVSTERAS